jgi:TPR repeat protein
MGLVRQPLLAATLLVQITLAVAQSNAIGDGVAAYDRGDYAHARTLLEPQAIAGDPAAQFHMGLMYARGEGVDKDLAAAARWFEQAAEQGNAHAQYIVGHMYAAGDGVPADAVQSYKWFSIAAAQGWGKARASRERLLSGKMPAAQIARAQHAAREWLERHGIAGAEPE